MTSLAATPVCLDLGFCYNDGADDSYGEAAPAVGFRFLQAAIPSRDANNTLINSDKYFAFNELKSGFKALRLNSFVKYIGSDPVFTDPNDAVEAYNYLSGYGRTGLPFINSVTGETTKFVHPDDPNLNVDDTDDIWVDGDDNRSNDRRMLMGLQPFNFIAGDSAEISMVLLHGQGISSLNSVSVLKVNSKIAQFIYDASSAGEILYPEEPKVDITALDEEIILEWGSEPESYRLDLPGNVSSYIFEGYNIYQYEANDLNSERIKLATFDVINSVGLILDEVYSTEHNITITIPVQEGHDSGIKRFLSVIEDAFSTDSDNLDKSFINNRLYYFAVTSYAYNGKSYPKTLESDPHIITIRPHTPSEIEIGDLSNEEIIPVEHSSGKAAGIVDAKIINPINIKNDSYEIYFEQLYYYLDIDGLWKESLFADSIEKNIAKDLSGTTVSGLAYTSTSPGTRDLRFILDISASPDYNLCDGLQLKFPGDITINSALDVKSNRYYRWFTPVIDQNNNTVTWGAKDSTTDGDFAGDELFTVNINTTTLPLDVEFTAFDDGASGGTINHGTGICTITKEAYDFKTINYWNLKNAAGTLLLENMSTLNGIESDYIKNGIYYEGRGNIGVTTIPVINGFQVNVKGDYSYPLMETSIISDGDGTYDWNSYLEWNWAPTSMAIDTWGFGTTDINMLTRDIQIRFTGEYEAPVLVNGMNYYRIKPGTGSLATWVGAQNYIASDHPDYDGHDYFQVRIPFEVWDMEADNGPKQISIIIYDRKGNPNAGTGDFYAFNPNDRMYVFIWNEPYDESMTYDNENHGDYLTWNLIAWESDWIQGDILDIVYSNPFQPGVDSYSFETIAPEIITADLNNIKVWPNPYFGYNPEEGSVFDRQLHFINLPETATIRIFNLYGQLIRKLEHNGSQIEIWDLLNSHNSYVASGMYIAIIETDSGQKILKLAIVNR